MMTKGESIMEYLYIRAWGRMLNSAAYYVQDQVEKARRDKAPANSIYYDDKKKEWRTFDDITNSMTRFTLQNILDQFERERQLRSLRAK
jgi:hypothetical protein